MYGHTDLVTSSSAGFYNKLSPNHVVISSSVFSHG